MSRKTIVPLAIVAGVEVYPIRGAEGEEPPGGTEGGGGEKGKSEKDNDDEDPDDDEEEDPEAEEDKDKRKLIRQTLRRKEELRVKNAELEAANEKLRQLELKDKTDFEKLQSDHEVLKTKYDKLLASTSTSNMENEALKVSPRLKLEWRDVDDVLSWLGRHENVKVEEDGTVTGVEKALKELAKAKPHWLKEETTSGAGGSASGANVGGSKGGKGSGKEADRAALEAKYPALARGRG